jgi:2-iminobutanoate/2-iminopropanoate deaminase
MPRRLVYTAVAVAFSLIAAGGQRTLAAQQPARQVIVAPGGRAGGMLSPAIKVGNLVFASGQLGGAADTTIEAQTTTALTTMKTLFEAAGTNMDNVVKCTVFLTDVKEFGKMNEAYARFFPADKGAPARSTVVVAALVRATAKVEIECIAAMPH